MKSEKGRGRGRIKDPHLAEEAEIKEIKRETYDTKTFVCAFRDENRQKSFAFQPGQFNMVGIFGVGEAPFSITSDPFRKNAFEHTIRRVGNVTRALHGLREGDTVYVRGPYGRGWQIEEAKGKNVLIVAGGIGLPPLRPFIMYARERREEFGDIEILYGARTPADLVYSDQFDDIQRIRDTKLLLTVDAVPEGQKWKHKVGVVTTLFEDMKLTEDNTIALTCGPEVMLRFVVRGLLERGFSEDQIYLSLERRMKCGIGKCGHCQIGSKFVCLDGPVFRYGEVKDLPDMII